MKHPNQQSLDDILAGLRTLGGGIESRLRADTAALRKLPAGTPFPAPPAASKPKSRPEPAPEKEPATEPSEEEKADSIKAVIKEGARTGRKVVLVYRKSKGTVVRRVVSSYEYKRGMLYLKHKHTKSFKLDGLMDAKLTKVKANPDYPVKI